MRLRNIPDAKERLEQCPNYIKNPEEWLGKWAEYFGNNHDIHIEIGAGKGRFIATLAQQHPEINYIAIERSATVLLQLGKKLPESGLQNLAIISIDAAELDKCFDAGEIAKIYLNFSDPWTKKKHAKRRLTALGLLKLYKKILMGDGLLEFKTDNRGLFDFSLEELGQSDFEVTAYTYDLYNSPYLEGNIPTEYEERFHKLGVPINKLFARIKEGGKES